MSDTPVEINYDEPRPASSHRSRLRNLYFLCRMREMINFVLLQSNLIEKLSSFNCQRHPRPHSPQPVWTISVPFCPKWYLTAAVVAADSCAILRPAVTAVRTSPQPPATTQLLVTFGDGKLFWQTEMSVARTPWDSYVITWAWPPDVTLCDRGGGWCELVSAPRQCQLSSVLRGHCSWLVRGQSTPSHGGEEWAETGHGVPILCHRPSGQLVWALIDRNIVRVRVWDTKKTRHCPSPTNNNRAEEIPLWPDQSMIESLKIRREEID